MPTTTYLDFRENYPSINLSYPRKCCVRPGVLGWANKQMQNLCFPQIPQLPPFSCLCLFAQASLPLPRLAPCCRLHLLSAISSLPHKLKSPKALKSLPTPFPLLWISLGANETLAIVSQLFLSLSLSSYSVCGCRRDPSSKMQIEARCVPDKNLPKALC